MRSGIGGVQNKTKADISELISLKRPSNRSRWYGYPDWLAAMSDIELSQCLSQYKYDFFNNRGVPEFMMLVTGADVDEEDWKEVQKVIQNCIGTGNSHKTVAINLPNPNVEGQILKV